MFASFCGGANADAERMLTGRFRVSRMRSANNDHVVADVHPCAMIIAAKQRQMLAEGRFFGLRCTAGSSGQLRPSVAHTTAAMKNAARASCGHPLSWDNGGPLGKTTGSRCESGRVSGAAAWGRRSLY